MSDLIERLRFDGNRKSEATRHEAADRIEALEAALRCADQFITNGIELGYIRMPDADTPDSAHKTPDIIRATLAPGRK